MAISIDAGKVVDFTGSIRGTSCCGLADYEGVGYIRSTADAMAVRRAAHRATGGGLVFVTVTDTQLRSRPEVVEYLKEAGFSKHRRFINPNTRHGITLFTAETIKRKVRGEDRIDNERYGRY